MGKDQQIAYTGFMARILAWFRPTINMGRSLRGEIRIIKKKFNKDGTIERSTNGEWLDTLKEHQLKSRDH